MLDVKVNRSVNLCFTRVILVNIANKVVFPSLHHQSMCNFLEAAPSADETILSWSRIYEWLCSLAGTSKLAVMMGTCFFILFISMSSHCITASLPSSLINENIPHKI